MNLGDPVRNAQASAVIGALAANKTLTQVMKWKGSKIPRGGKVGNIEIGWSQHDIITGKNGEQLGFYERLQEFGGANHDEHVMLIRVNEPATNPDGTLCDNSGPAIE